MTTYEYNSVRGPKLYRHLIGTPASSLFHEKHANKTRHPADILREELQAISGKFNAIVEISRNGTKGEDSAEKIKSFITKIDEFYEQLQVIIKCFTPPDHFEEKGRLDDALRAANRSTWQNFSGRTKNLHEPIRLAANALKHAGAKPVFVTVRNHRNVEVNGFYVSRVLGGNDQRGADPKIHKKYRGKINTAFSFNHLLSSTSGRIHCYLDALDKSIFKKKDPDPASQLIALDKLTETAAILAEDFFPDEYLNPYSKIKKDKNTYFVEFPYRYRIKPGENPDLIFEVKSKIEINQRTSSSNSFLPYLQLTRPEDGLGLDKSPWR